MISTHHATDSEILDFLRRSRFGSTVEEIVANVDASENTVRRHLRGMVRVHQSVTEEPATRNERLVFLYKISDRLSVPENGTG